MENSKKERALFVLWNAVVSLGFFLVGIFCNETINTEHKNQLCILIAVILILLTLLSLFHLWFFAKLKNYFVVQEFYKYIAPIISVLILIVVERTYIKNNDYLLWGDKIANISKAQKIIFNIDELNRDMIIVEEISRKNPNSIRMSEITREKREFLKQVSQLETGK